MWHWFLIISWDNSEKVFIHLCIVVILVLSNFSNQYSLCLIMLHWELWWVFLEGNKNCAFSCVTRHFIQNDTFSMVISFFKRRSSFTNVTYDRVTQGMTFMLSLELCMWDFSRYYMFTSLLIQHCSLSQTTRPLSVLCLLSFWQSIHQYCLLLQSCTYFFLLYYAT